VSLFSAKPKCAEAQSEIEWYSYTRCMPAVYLLLMMVMMMMTDEIPQHQSHAAPSLSQQNSNSNYPMKGLKQYHYFLPTDVQSMTSRIPACSSLPHWPRQNNASSGCRNVPPRRLYLPGVGLQLRCSGGRGWLGLHWNAVVLADRDRQLLLTVIPIDSICTNCIATVVIAATTWDGQLYNRATQWTYTERLDRSVSVWLCI